MAVVDGVMERPILMSGPMVRAILDGRKLQTRRELKAPIDELFGNPVIQFSDVGHSGAGWYAGESDYLGEGSAFLRCPYGKPGDRLWVRETWCGHWGDAGESGAVKFSNGESVKQHDGSLGIATEANPLWIYYRSTFGDAVPLDHLKWHPSIHMPRWASRILLEVTSVRVERLQDITEEDAIAEGCPHGGRSDLNSAGEEILESTVDWFRRLWGSINGDDSWNSNPWVWVVEFSRVGTGNFKS